MKYAVVLGDGMADRKIESLGGKTCLEYAKTPNIDKLAPHAEAGMFRTVPAGFNPGSDVANMSVMGFDPKKYYSGRSPLEAVAMGIPLKDTDVTLRANLVTLSGDGAYEDMTMADYSSGEITTAEATELITFLKRHLDGDGLTLYPGISYRHCLVIDGGKTGSDSPAQTHSSYVAAKAFNGVTYSTSDSERWLGSIQNGVYLRYAMPDDYTSPFLLRGYRLHALSCSWYNTDRAPRSWELYGHLDANAAADDEGWQLIDTQTDVVWPFTSGDYDASVQGSQFVLEFSVSTMLNFRAFKWVPTKSARPSSDDTWTVGLMELVFLGQTASASDSLQIQGSQGEVGSTSPAYGVVEGLDSGMTVDVSAEEFAYTNAIRYVCIGYCTEVLQADGTWLMETTNLGVRAFTYVSDGQVRRLTWLWEENGYKLTTGVESGLESVTASPAAESDGYYAAGTRVTLTPVCATDPVSYFKNWYGDIPADATAETSPTIVMDAPKTVYADFSRTWKAVEGVSNQITDGNWILSISTGNPCSIGVSGRSAYSAGGGALDLTGVYGNLGLTISAIGQSAFSGCSALTSVTMPESVTRLENDAFMNGSKVRSVQLSSALTFIGNYAFDKCSSLASVAPFLPDEVSTIGIGV